jgi:rhodanese-related sulfurtransferase
MAQTLQRIFLLLAFGAGLGLLVNAVSPKSIPLITPPKKIPQPEEFITLEKAYELWSSGTAFILDARKPEDFAAGHIAQAHNLPADKFEEHFVSLAPLLPPDAELIVYCEGDECEMSQRLADSLRQFGFSNVHMLHNGWTAWRNAGYPVETGESR